MVFWKTYPLAQIIQAKINLEKFKSQIFERKHIHTPIGVKYNIIKYNDSTNLSELRGFLRQYFGNPPQTPILDIPESQLLGRKDYIIIVRDDNCQIIGCIRYHYLGIFITSNNEPIYCVDCFCIHPKWRGKGLGDYLLTKLHIYVNENKIPFSLFLKEGRKLSIIHTPLYSGTYVYKELNALKESHAQLNNIRHLTPLQAYRLMDIFRELNHNIFIIRNIESTNQIWKLYRKGTYKVLACFQDTFQWFEENGKKKRMGWITAWIESPNLSDNIREEASLELADSIYNTFDYIWMNKEWSGNSSKWKVDGGFHFYPYQWTTAVNIKRSYCMLM